MAIHGKTGWSVMGTGTIATEQMVAGIRAQGHTPLWVVSRRKMDAAHFAQDLDIPQWTTNLSEALGDPKVEFTYVSARLRRRAHYITAAAKARKNVLCDGPISENSKVAAELARLCDAAGIVLAVHQPFRASAIHQTMRRLILDGDIGKVQSILLTREGPYKPAAKRRKDDLDNEGDIYLDMSVDDIDLARFLTGGEPREVSAICTVADGRPNQISYSFQLDDGSLFHAFESFAIADLESTVVVAGDRGTLIAHGTLNGKASGTLMRRHAAKNELVPVRDGDSHVAAVEDFVSAGERRLTWLARGSDNVAALRAAEALAKAASKRRTATVQGGQPTRSLLKRDQSAQDAAGQ
ncbi:Gfo/Idh/MocA family oxidoreductase [Mesorhizobium sp.]|uniref:Gfo/Idh/MocA family protein n=1 Tax=Mesorhizobium sp. TaxID=1871066 RepID=UPI000FE49FEC|nr:Gfo/Idh/MocA family oxidoreductase [Mesorhizobium sp.]RWH31277.1 MAG: Gfo/Idh/MocA family oxidoreductase [Mesorhizobium sp.]RWH38302.1 MAG: Gfo/Idh/MocA family oxidoreductase [Mesorhizobium sp.]TIM70786.1 MAG: Gfo/Idh/MocA family oxidoreductase [Mesorhizobium sp.]TIR61558.1 MAG: Gfo/Idh/MocA family oxidoreductase [Mesorhizobium sp.]TIR72672.1 MAG: Gfo/Idh/MocA family oxidoreductase [Mesorhizobium sp.]